MPITTKVVSSNPVHDEVYSMQHNVIKFVSYLRQVGKFSSGTPVFSTNKTDRHDITEILLKVALNTIILTLPFLSCCLCQDLMVFFFLFSLRSLIQKQFG